MLRWTRSPLRARVLALLLPVVCATPLAACAAARGKSPQAPPGSAVPATAGTRPVSPPRAAIAWHEATSSEACACSVPSFEPPDPRARAALAAQIEQDLGRFLHFEVAEDETGGASLDCRVTVATRSLVSFICASMQTRQAKAEVEEGVGGAPAEETLDAFVYLIDDGVVRTATLDDVFARSARASSSLPEIARRALERDGELPCPRWSMPELAPEPRFTLDERGLTLHFQRAEYGSELDYECAKREVRLAYEDVAALVLPDGAFARVRGHD
ncbi:MAG: hypothetical protein KF894_25980 [Labilithrix sp.]|nr:hypothetical protein [Labilithrix sp.]